MQDITNQVQTSLPESKKTNGWIIVLVSLLLLSFLCICIGVISIGLSASGLSKVRSRARDTKRRFELGNIVIAMEELYSETSEYPESIEVNGGEFTFQIRDEVFVGYGLDAYVLGHYVVKNRIVDCEGKEMNTERLTICYEPDSGQLAVKLEEDESGYIQTLGGYRRIAN